MLIMVMLAALGAGAVGGGGVAGAQGQVGLIPIVCGATNVRFTQLPVDHPLETDSVRVTFFPTQRFAFLNGTVDDEWKNLNPPPETPWNFSSGYVAGWPITGFGNAPAPGGRLGWFGVPVTAPAILAVSGPGFVTHIFIFRIFGLYEGDNGDIYEGSCFTELNYVRLMVPYSSLEPDVPNNVEEPVSVSNNGYLGRLVWSPSWTPTPTPTSTPTVTPTPTSTATVTPTRTSTPRTTTGGGGRTSSTSTPVPSTQCSQGCATATPTVTP